MYEHVHMMMNFPATKKLIPKAKWAVLNSLKFVIFYYYYHYVSSY